MMRTPALVSVVLGAIVSVGLMIRAGQRTPRFLLAAFIVWVLAPFAALLWAIVASKSWSTRARVMLYGVAIVIAAVSPLIYGKLIPMAPAGSANAFVWVIVPPVSCLLIVVAVLIPRLAVRRAVASAFVLVALLWPIAHARQASDIPIFEVDAAWPKPLPNKWAVGPVSGIAADARDHIWIIHRREGVKEPGRVPAPPVIEFDAAGNVVQTWGGPGAGYDWPQQVHGITVDDANGRVWITGNGEKDAHILAFTRAGKFLRQIGRAGMSGGSNNTANVARATQVRVDARAKEIYVSDGEQNQNHRVIVFDSETGAYKRHWGAYGEKPDDAGAAAPIDPAGPPPRQFGTAVHCVRIDRDDRVYVCDRSNSRFQIFRKNGRFEKEVFVAKDSGAAGTVYDLDFSPDQRFVYVADGGNQKVWILRRDDMRVAGSFGGRGPGAGQFATSLHDLTVDSQGNIYTGEAAAGGRVQKFALNPARK